MASHGTELAAIAKTVRDAGHGAGTKYAELAGVSSSTVTRCVQAGTVIAAHFDYFAATPAAVSALWTAVCIAGSKASAALTAADSLTVESITEARALKAAPKKRTVASGAEPTSDETPAPVAPVVPKAAAPVVTFTDRRKDATKALAALIDEAAAMPTGKPRTVALKGLQAAIDELADAIAAAIEAK